ncbi:cytochrome P450 [Aspergillus lucknowensis]|uniref:Cytochrome P450 n=1 Tax=Aspergillus lucknowensis TaxID=176173 RepID=A0ABR4LGB0_9EURO
MALISPLETVRGSIALYTGAVFLLVYFLTSIHRRWSRYRFAKAHGCGPIPAIPTYDPFMALDRLYFNIKTAKQRKILETNVARFVELGNTVRAQRITTPMILTREPENVKTILSLKFNDYSMGDRLQIFGRLLGHGIFTSDGEDWTRSRHMIRPNFVKEQVAHLEIFEELMEDLFALIPADGSTVDLQDLFFGFTIDSATEFLFGHNVHSLKKRRSQVVDNEPDFPAAFNYSLDNIVMNSRFGPLQFLNRDPKAVEANRICHQMVEQFVDKAMRVREKYDEEKATGETEESRRYVFLNGLAQQTGNRTRIRDELMNVLLAGRDTTASLLSNMFFMLAKHPKVWAKLQEELATLEGRAPTYEQLRNLKYLKYCMNESLRLHPVVPVNSRTAIKDTVIPVGGGPDGRSPVFVPKGTIVAYSVWAMHRREDFYGPDAEEFRPERWETLRPGWEYLPFNGGPRICVGQQYALTEAAYVTTRLAQRYSVIESRDAGPWEEKLTLTLCSHNGTKVSLRH